MTAHRPLGDVLHGHRRHDRAQHLDLFVAERVAVEVRRRLHRADGKQLQHVALHHVAQRAGLLVVGAAALDAERFGHRDLDVIDVVTVPDRLEQDVGEAEGEHVLHGFFAEVVIDPIDLPLGKDGGDLGVQRAGALQIVAEWFFDDDAVPTRRSVL